MAESLFGGVITTLQNMGFFDVILPFLLVFAIIYGVLERAKLFENRHGLNAIIAFVIGMIVIGTAWVVGVVSGFLPWIGMMSVVFLGAIILMSFFWKDFDAIASNQYIKIIAGVVILAVFAVVLIPMIFPDVGGAGELPFNVADIGALIVILAVIFGIILITKGGNKGDSNA